MILLFLFSFVNGLDKGIKKYAIKAIPKALYFEKLNGEIKVKSFSSESEKYIVIKASNGERDISVKLLYEGGQPELVWADADNIDGWIYQQPTQEEVKITMKYMMMLVNSLQPPRLVRITSHRMKNQSNFIHHQLTIIVTIMGKPTMHFIEYKINAVTSKNSFVNHNVIIRENEKF